MRLKGNRLWIYPLPSASTTAVATQHHRHCTPRSCDADCVANKNSNDDDGSSCNNKLEKWNDNDDHYNHPSTTVGMLNLLIRNLPRMTTVKIEEIDISGIEITQPLADCIVRLLQFGNIRRLAILLCPCTDPNRVRYILSAALKYNKDTLQQLEWQETPNTSPPPPPSTAVSSSTPPQTAAAVSHIDDNDDCKIQSTHHQHHQCYHLSTVRLNIRISYHQRRRQSHQQRQGQIEQPDQETHSSSWFLNDLFTTSPLPSPFYPSTTPPFRITVQHLYLNGSCLDPPSLLRLGIWLQQQVHVLETLSLKWCRLEDDDVANLVSSFLPHARQHPCHSSSQGNDDGDSIIIPLKVLDVAGNRCGTESIKAISHLMECPHNSLHTLDLSNQLLYNHSRDNASPKVAGVLLKSPFTLEEEVIARILPTSSFLVNNRNCDGENDDLVDDEGVNQRTKLRLPLQELGRALQSPNCQLQKLRLSGDDLTDECIKPLLVSGTTTATARSQPQPHDVVVDRSFCSHTLKTLDLSANALSDEGISNLVCSLLMQQQQVRTAKSSLVLASINASSSLQELNVKANPFQGLGMARLLYLMQRQTTLASLVVEPCKWSLLIRAAVTYHDLEVAHQQRQRRNEGQVKTPNTFHLPLPQLPLPNEIVYIMSTKLGTKQPRKIDVFDDVSIFPPPVRSPLTDLTLEWIQQEIQYATNLNASGRQLLAWPVRNQFPLSLWPVVLERINRSFYSCCPESDSENDASRINVMEATRPSVSSDACILHGSYQANRASSTLRRRSSRRRYRGGADDDSNCGKTTAATVLYYFLRHGPALLENQYLFSIEME